MMDTGLFSWMRAKRLGANGLLCLLWLALGLTGCERAPAPPAAEPAFTVLAGSELKEIAPALTAAAAQAGVSLKLSYAGALDVVEQVNRGQQHPSAILIPNGAYASLVLKTKPVAQEKLFYSRVALGIKPEALARLGWQPDLPPTWAQVAQAAAAGTLRYAMTSPIRSNSGMTALFAVAAAAAGKTEGLGADEVNTQVLESFLTGQKLTADSSGWLADAVARTPAAIDAMVNYEAVIVRLNEWLPPADRLVLLYPADGVMTADYPLMLLDESQRHGFDKLVAAMKSEGFQGEVVAKMHLRPVSPAVQGSPSLPTAPVAELAFPNQLAVIDQVLSVAVSQVQRPATTVWVLDASALVREGPSSDAQRQRNAQMQHALLEISGLSPPTATETRVLLAKPERMVFIQFWGERFYAMDAYHKDLNRADLLQGAVQHLSRVIENAQSGTEAEMERWQQNLENDWRDQGQKGQPAPATALLRSQGGNGQLYAALQAARQIALQERSQDPHRLVNIFLLTDGRTRNADGLREFLRPNPNPVAMPARIFPLVWGQASAPEMQALAGASGGQVYDMGMASPTQVFLDTRRLPRSPLLQP